MDIHCVVSDLDGTLLSPDHTVPEDVRENIEQYHRRGGLFTLATGRPLLTAQTIIHQLKIQLPVILCNGAVIVWGGRVVERYSLRAALLFGLAADAFDRGANVLLFREDRVEVFVRNDDIVSFEHKESIRCSLVEVKSAAWRAGLLDKIVLLGDIRLLREIWERWSAVVGSEVAAFQSEPNFIELVSKHASKGSALMRLSELIDVPARQIMAIGNQMNDLPMLQAAGVGAAVANSPKELKEAADYVCTASYGYGVLEAMERYAFSNKKRYK